MVSMRQAFSAWCNEHDVASQFEAWNRVENLKKSTRNTVVMLKCNLLFRFYCVSDGDHALYYNEYSICMLLYSFFDWAFKTLMQMLNDSVPSLSWLWLPDANSAGTTTRDGCGAGCVLQAYISHSGNPEIQLDSLFIFCWFHWHSRKEYDSCHATTFIWQVWSTFS